MGATAFLPRQRAQRRDQAEAQHARQPQREGQLGVGPGAVERSRSDRLRASAPELGDGALDFVAAAEHAEVVHHDFAQASRSS
jgi:hypothetical protein